VERLRNLVAGLTVAVAIGGLVAVGAWLVPRLDVPSQFWFSPMEAVSIDGRALRVVQVGYNQGLRTVETLGGLDGALFVLDHVADIESGMGMFDTRMALDVVFFDASGRFITRYTMPVCESEDCPAYYPARPWQFAIEAPAGSLSWIADSATLAR
jgi:uncharacterized membrane protein (UPF0127 family)